jgi:hypothetical protein
MDGCQYDLDIQLRPTVSKADIQQALADDICNPTPTLSRCPAQREGQEDIDLQAPDGFSFGPEPLLRQPRLASLV